ncbi:hypothetical protein [Streptomyces sp. NPDC058157]|uniref:hypothetical protein n=1 Tax=Streptomyces sp. NPDC058157 TaxID=3346360 RepID=UPI0036F11551
MTSNLGFTCTGCGTHHPELAMNHTADAPAVWDPACALNLKTYVHTRPVGEHPLAVEQRTGITLDRVREIASAVLHAGDGGELP